MDRVDQRPAESWAGLGEQVESLHDTRMGYWIKAVDPVPDLVYEVDFPGGPPSHEYSEQ